MTINPRRPFTVMALAVLTAVASVVIAGPVAGAAPAADPGDTGALKPVAVPQLTVPGTGKKVAAFQSLKEISPAASPGAYGLAPDPAAAAAGSGVRKAGPRPRKADSASTQSFGTQSFYCDEVIDKNVQTNLQLLHVDYAADVYCNFYLIEADGVAGVIDRTPGYDGQILSVGSQFYFQFDYYGYSTGGFELSGNAYGGARSIEVIEELYLYSDIPWSSCNPLPNLRYLACDGLGGYLLHVIIGTGAFSTGLLDPLYLGAGQGEGCPLSTSYSLDPSEGPASEHFVKVGFAGTISCPSGVTGNSQARLIDEYQGNGELARGGDGGANASSQGEVTRRESEHGGRELHIVYSGRTVAPGNRNWSGCNDTATVHFTRCDRSGNTVDWEAVSPVFQTGLPTDRYCSASRYEPTMIDMRLIAKGIGRCAEPIDAITVTIALGGEYTDNEGTRHDVSIPGGPTENVRGIDTDEVIAEKDFPCDPESQQSVAYDLIVLVRFQHPEGWLQTESLGSIVISQQCLPA
jgi:hypothetical protein